MSGGYDRRYGGGYASSGGSDRGSEGGSDERQARVSRLMRGRGDGLGDSASESFEDYNGERETMGSFDGQPGGKKDALSILMKLADALEDEGGDRSREDINYFGDDGADSQGLGGKPAKGTVDYDNMLLDTFQSGDPKRRLGGLRRAKITIESSDDEDDEDPVYCAAPYNQPDLEAMAGDQSIEPPVEAQPIYPRDADAAVAAGIPYKKFQRQRKVNWYGSTMFGLYIIALCFYCYIRVGKTLGLGSYVAYGVYVFIVEILGAIATLLYGVNLVWDPINEVPETDPADPALPLVGMNYHVRVLIPCYREPLSIVSKTILAAQDAIMPNGCQRSVYVCDDGKDPKLKKFCRSLGPDVTYVSGRRREPGESNGKSGNLNNCLMQIYPEGLAVPPHEVVAIFDADQVANPDFFLKTLPLFDGGNDVGMVLSPQCFHNLRLHADVFNHANIHFWEYAQHGYDALGFISCTGTNFLTRSMAFQEAGWSPTFTLTEDFALGMYLKANKWHCRYVEEYLAIGEAPDQVRNCFQQRSRWCKGHFQVVFSWEHCPLRVKNLSFLHRLLYCSGVFSYIVGAITTPTFIIIPLLTVWVGIFPIVVSFWAAAGLTVYAIAQHLVLSYCRKLKHIEALWFAGIANNILWWTFAKAAFNALAAKLGKKVTFKATLKGTAAKIVASALGDLWLPSLFFILCAVSFGIGLGKLIGGPTVITTLAISVAWIVYGMIPPFLLLHYTFIGRGATLAFWSRVMFVLSFLAAGCAILLLWFVYPKDFNFGQAAGDSLLFYDAQAVGQLPANDPISFRQSALLYEADSSAGFPDLTGGWLQGGVGGDLKLTMPTAFAVTMLAWSVLSFPSGFSSAGETAHAMENVKWGTDYLMKTVRPGNVDQTSSAGYTIVYQVGNLTTDVDFWGTPESMTQQAFPRPAYLVYTQAGAADLASSIAAALASGSMVLRSQNASYADQLMQTATDLYNEAKAFPGTYTSQLPQYGCVSRFAKASIGTAQGAQSCPAPTEFANGTAAYFFNSTTFWDDLLFGAGWMFRATGDQSYMTDVNDFYPMYQSQEAANDLGYITDWNHVYQAANVLLAVATNDVWYHETVQVMLQNWICALGGTTAFTPQGRAWNPLAPTTGATANVAFLAAVYGQFQSKSISAAQSARYVCFARTQMRYILGDKTDSLMVGNGKKPPTHAQNRAASCPNPPAVCNADDALYTPNPNPHVLTGAVVEFASFSDNYQDVRTSNDSRVSIDNNAGVTGAMAGLVNAPGTWDSCLQGYGVLTGSGGVCAAGNVISA